MPLISRFCFNHKVPFENVVRSVRQQLEAIMKGDMSIRVGAEGDKTFHNIMYAAISVAPEAVIGALNKVCNHITCMW